MMRHGPHRTAPVSVTEESMTQTTLIEYASDRLAVIADAASRCFARHATITFGAT
jgi:hypothetical protein